MDQKNIPFIESVKDVIVQIATPYSVGTGFYVAAYDLIITNEHIVRDNQKVVIDGDAFPRQLVDVLFVDENFDIAFLQVPTEHQMPSVNLRVKSEAKVGELVIAFGHPLGQEHQLKQGSIDSIEYNENGIDYYHHSASLSPGNSGGPLFDLDGNILGVNTFLIQSGFSKGYTLPIAKLISSIDVFVAKGKSLMIKCGECHQYVTDPKDQSTRCHYCGARVSHISNIATYEPIGINLQIESMLADLGFDPEISRRGPYNWEVKQGSAFIHITYHERTGLINGDAHLCKVPLHDILPLYQFLLKSNYDLEGLSFTVKDQEVILSLLIYDQYLNKLTALRLFKHLFEMADKYDDILIDVYGAHWLD